MDLQTQRLLTAAAGGGEDPVYVDDVFNITTRHGTGDTGTVTVNTGLDMLTHGGMIMIKGTNGGGFAVYDTERHNGSGTYYRMETASSGAETSDLTMSFTNTGFTFSSNSATYNANNRRYVIYSFRRCPGFFDIVTYTGATSTNRALAHSLGDRVQMCTIKRRDSSGYWYTYNPQMAGDSLTDARSWYMYWNDTKHRENYQIDNMWGTQNWDNNNFRVGGANTNTDSATYVAYLWSGGSPSYTASSANNLFGKNKDQQIAWFTSYQGNGQSDDNGPSVSTSNFPARPQWVLTKIWDDEQSWAIDDYINNFNTMTSGKNRRVRFNNESPLEEATNVMPHIEYGYQLMHSNSNWNANNKNYTSFQIREADPYVCRPLTAGTDLHQQRLSGGYGNSYTLQTYQPYVWTAGSVETGGENNFWPVDFAYSRYVDDSGYWSQAHWSHRLGDYFWFPAANGNNSNHNNFDHRYTTGYGQETSHNNYHRYMFRRGEGFQTVGWWGNGNNGRAVNTRLGGPADFFIIKRVQDNGYEGQVGTRFAVNAEGTGNYGQYRLETANADALDTNDVWNDTNWGENIELNSNYVNANDKWHVGMFFRSVEGYQKFGRYSGNSSTNVTVTTGFQPRFLVIKGLSGGMPWRQFPAVDGMGSGNDYSWRWNSTSVWTTNVDFLTVSSTGFTLIAGASADTCTDGNDYIYWAIA